MAKNFLGIFFILSIIIMGSQLRADDNSSNGNSGCKDLIEKKMLVNCPCKFIEYDDTSYYFAEQGYYSYQCSDKKLVEKAKAHLEQLEEQNDGHNGWHVTFSGFKEKANDKHKYTCYTCTKLSDSNLNDSTKLIDCTPYSCELTGYEKAMTEYKSKPKGHGGGDAPPAAAAH